MQKFIANWCETHEFEIELLEIVILKPFIKTDAINSNLILFNFIR